MYGIIYRATNIITNKIYIGQTQKNLKLRMKEHFSDKRTYFHFALKKYGKKSFIFEIIDHAHNQKELNNKEIYWIKYYKSNIKKNGYNQTEGGNNGRFSKVIKKKLSERQLGELNHNWKGGKKKYKCIICNKIIMDYRERKYCSRKCTIKGQIGKGNPFYNKKHTNKTINLLKYKQKNRSNEINKKISESQKKRLKNKINHPMYNKKHSEETKRKMSYNAKERFKNKKNHPFYGKKHSKESIEKNRISNIIAYRNRKKDIA